jgi:hypothetical protein
MPLSDNTNLIKLLDICSQNRSQETMDNVLKELQTGNSTLFIPSQDNNNRSSEWEVQESGKTLSWYLFNQHGLKVLAAFTGTDTMLKWSKGTSVHYTEMFSKDVLKLIAEGKAGEIDRILINPNNLNVFPIDRQIVKTDLYNFPSDGKIYMGTPAKPLTSNLISKLKENFKKVDSISDAYQYCQSSKDESAIVIGIKLSIDSMNSRQAAQLAFEKSMLNANAEDGTILMHIIKDENQYNIIKGIKDSLIYKRD